jgi:hypothetical protein
MTSAQILSQYEKDYHKAREKAVEILADAMCEVYKMLTGAHASDKLREALYEAVRFEA